MATNNPSARHATLREHSLNLRSFPEALLTGHVLIAGTASRVGKNTLACGIARLRAMVGRRPIPFKPIAIECFPARASRSMTPSITLQTMAAGIPSRRTMNPVRVLYDLDRRKAPQLYLVGKRCARLSILANRAEIGGLVRASIRAMDGAGDHFIVESAGGFAEWSDSVIGQVVFDELRPTVVLVADTYDGGALAAVAGTLALLTKPWQERVSAVVFNNVWMDGAQTAVNKWKTWLEETHGVRNVGVLPRLTFMRPLCEETWPMASASRIEQSLRRLAVSVGECLSCVGTSSKPQASDQQTTLG